MKKNKGFTLIELLAVIVILAIIALIATPIILNIINDSKEKSNLRSIEGFGRAVEQTVARIQINSNYKNGEIICTYDSSQNTYCYESGNEDKTKTDVSYSGSKVIGNIIVNKKGGSIVVLDAKVGSDSNYYNYSTSKGIVDDINNVIAKGDIKYTTSSYFTIENGAVSINDSYNGEDPTNLIIPESIDGVTVTSIADGGFQDITSKVVVFPSTLEEIGANAFNGSSIETVVFTIGSENVSFLDYSFSSSNIKKITFPKGSNLSSEGILEGNDHLITIVNQTGEDICWPRIIGAYSGNSYECEEEYPNDFFETGTYNDDAYNFKVIK